MKLCKDVSVNIKYIGLIIFVSVCIWSFAFYTKEIKTYKNTVSVIGVATKDVTSDFASWRISIAKKSLDRAKNMRDINEDEKTIKTFLTNKNINFNKLSKSSISVNTIYKQNANGYGATEEVSNYETTSTFTINSKEVNKIEKTVNELRQFTEENNIDLSLNMVEYTYSKYETEKIPLLQKAIIDAQNRANALVNATKGVSRTSIGKIISAQQGIFQVNAANDNSVSDYGNFDTSSINKTIRATVTVEFSAN